ncbi:MAG: hypothetical protein PWP54_433 [Thermosipho sp. (in: thermotogales)]|nr:hypothetical protein [Thermosipho sp. (in: thermotogales)]MDN5324631.1 hypothetical protein [Thermosipho sp. (in: thermotogales)]
MFLKYSIPLAINEIISKIITIGKTIVTRPTKIKTINKIPRKIDKMGDKNGKNIIPNITKNITPRVAKKYNISSPPSITF